VKKVIDVEKRKAKIVGEYHEDLGIIVGILSVLIFTRIGQVLEIEIQMWFWYAVMGIFGLMAIYRRVQMQKLGLRG
jgi:hypothetical protein